MENFCCQVILLHLVGSTGDSYIRLHYFAHYNRSASRRLTTFLKVGAPWFVGGCQSLAQALLCSTKEHVQFQGQRICLSMDLNFSILRTMLGFFIPLGTGMICLILTVNRVGQREAAFYKNSKNYDSCPGKEGTENDEIDNKPVSLTLEVRKELSKSRISVSYINIIDI